MRALKSWVRVSANIIEKTVCERASRDITFPSAHLVPFILWSPGRGLTVVLLQRTGSLGDIAMTTNLAAAAATLLAMIV